MTRHPENVTRHPKGVIRPLDGVRSTEEQQDLRDWVHGFAADVVRPAAAEWDEREEPP